MTLCAVCANRKRTLFQSVDAKTSAVCALPDDGALNNGAAANPAPAAFKTFLRSISIKFMIGLFIAALIAHGKFSLFWFDIIHCFLPNC
jgi:hypothetical protein